MAKVKAEEVRKTDAEKWYAEKQAKKQAKKHSKAEKAYARHLWWEKFKAALSLRNIGCTLLCVAVAAGLIWLLFGTSFGRSIKDAVANIAILLAVAFGAIWCWTRLTRAKPKAKPEAKKKAKPEATEAPKAPKATKTKTEDEDDEEVIEAVKLMKRYRDDEEFAEKVNKACEADPGEVKDKKLLKALDILERLDEDADFAAKVREVLEADAVAEVEALFDD